MRTKKDLVPFAIQSRAEFTFNEWDFINNLWNKFSLIWQCPSLSLLVLVHSKLKRHVVLSYKIWIKRESLVAHTCFYKGAGYSSSTWKRTQVISEVTEACREWWPKFWVYREMWQWEQGRQSRMEKDLGWLGPGGTVFSWSCTGIAFEEIPALLYDHWCRWLLKENTENRRIYQWGGGTQIPTLHQPVCWNLKNVSHLGLTTLSCVLISPFYKLGQRG